MTSVSQIDERRARGYTVTARSDGRRVFRAARRHSRLVRTLRIGIPLVVVLGILGTLVAATVLDPLRALAKLPVNLGGLVVSGTKITMQAPRLAGFTNDQRPYVVTARAAAQDITKPDVLELEDLHATMQMKDADTVKMSAQNGVYQTKADTLLLKNNIVVTSAAYQGRLSEAVINVRSGHLVSEKPVEITMKQGTINANRLEIIDSGDVIRFEQGVTLDLVFDNPPAERKAEVQ